MGAASVLQLVALWNTDRGVVEDLADLLKEAFFQCLILPGELLELCFKLRSRIEVHVCGLIKVSQMVQELFFGLEGID